MRAQCKSSSASCNMLEANKRSLVEMHTSPSRSLLVAVCLAVAINQLCCSLAQELPAIKVIHLSNSLEMAYDHPGTSSGLSYEDLLGAYEEFSSWNEESIAHLRATVPFIRLVVDFCLIPMKRIFNKDKNRLSNPELQRKFIERLEEFYERFRPLYYGEVLAEPDESFKSPKTDELIRILTDESDASNLTRDIVAAAWEEYRTFETKIDEVTLYENVYEKADELEQFLIYLNRADVNAMYEAVFPYIDQLNTDEERVATKRFYVEALQLRTSALS